MKSLEGPGGGGAGEAENSRLAVREEGGRAATRPGPRRAGPHCGGAVDPLPLAGHIPEGPPALDLARLTDSLTRRIEDGIAETSSFLFDPVIRLGVTGLSRAGKTVFITSLVANLLARGRMPQLRAEAEGRILAAYLQPQPDPAIPRFAYEDHLAALGGPEPHWPESTRSISTLRLSLKVMPSGFLNGLAGPRSVHLDITDYPGEWLLDLPLMGQDFETWSEAAIATARAPARATQAAAWLARTAGTDPSRPLDEAEARALAADFTAYLAASRKAGLSSVAPGRFLMPGDLEGSPALTFAPLPRPERKRVARQRGHDEREVVLE